MKRTQVLLATSVAGALMAWLPAELHAQPLPVTTGLQLWLNADVGVTTNASGQVTAWADQSGLGNHATQATAASCPTLAADSLNGHATLRVSGSQFMEVPNANGIDDLVNDVTILTVVKFDNLSGYRCVVNKCVGGVAAPFDWWNNASQFGGVTSFWLANSDVTPAYNRYVGTFAPPTGAYAVMGFRWKDGVVDQFLNDFNVGHAVSMLTTANGSTPLRIGRRADGVTQLLGNVAELLIYKPALSDSDTTGVITSYLQPKYALTFDIPPTVSITSPANNSTASGASAIPVTISVSDPDDYVRTVAVYGNGEALGTATATTTNSSATYQLEVGTLAAGVLTLTAVATDNYGRAMTSSPVVVNITGTVPTAPVAGGLKVWLAADAGITTNLSGGVTDWADQSSNGNDAVQLDEASAPLLVADAVNGKPVLHFNSSSPQFLEVSDSGTAFITDDFTTFAVARFAGSYPVLRQNVWSKCNGGVAGPVDWWFNTTTGAPFGYRGDGTSFAGTGGGLRGPALDQFSVLGMTVTAADGVMAHHLGFADNGTSVALTTTASAGPLRIGRRTDGGTQINGDLAEVLIYDHALSASDRSNVVAYLSGKYGVVQASYASPAPVVNITGPTNGTILAAPATVTFAATAASSKGVIASVTLSANGTTFATLTNPPYEVPLDLLTPGTVTFTAIATDSWGIQTSTSVVATVTGTASTPPVTSGLKVWLAADAGVTTNATGAVTAWTDQSSNGNDAYPTDESTSPLLVPNTLNGKPVLRFAGGNPGQFLEVLGDTSFLAGDISTFAIVKFNNFSGAPAYRTVWTKTAGSTGGNRAYPVDWYFASGTGVANLFRGDGFNYGNFSGGAASAGAFTVVGFKASGTTISHFRGYDVTASGTIATTPVDSGLPMRIGRRSDGGVQMNGDVAEILIYDHAVSDSDRLQIANYLYNKWGFTVVQVANQAPTIAITSPTDGTPVSAPGVLSVLAQAADQDNPITRVDFLANGSVVATRTAAPYQVPLEVLTPGPLTLTAQAVDVWGAKGTSAPVALTITGHGPAAPPSAGQVLWLKADAGVTTNADGTVASWTDQSDNGNHAGPDLTYGFPTPMLVADAHTGLPTLNFDGTVRYLLVASSPSLSLTNDWSLFYGASFDDFDTLRSICAKTTIAQPHPFDYYANTAGQAVVYRGDERGSTPITSSGALPAAAFVAAGVAVQGSQGTHYLQGAPNGTGSFSYAAIDDGTPLLIGTRDALDIYFKGNLSEILLYNRALVGDDLQSANSYLAGKYGIATVQLFSQPPALSVAQTGASTLQLSWLPGYAGYVLEGRADLASGAWSPMATNPPGNQVLVNPTNTARFFRLRSQ